MVAVHPMGGRLEQYTLQKPQEVLIVDLTIGSTPDQVLIFRGFSSSLMHSTAADPDVPVIPEHTEIHTITRYQAPYRPDKPKILEPPVSAVEFEKKLSSLGC